MPHLCSLARPVSTTDRAPTDVRVRSAADISAVSVGVHQCACHITQGSGIACYRRATASSASSEVRSPVSSITPRSRKSIVPLVRAGPRFGGLFDGRTRTAAVAMAARTVCLMVLLALGSAAALNTVGETIQLLDRTHGLFVRTFVAADRSACAPPPDLGSSLRLPAVPECRMSSISSSDRETCARLIDNTR